MKGSVYPLGYVAIQSIYGATRTDPTPMSKFPGHSKALATFIARRTEIDTILARLSALSAEHFNRAPEDVTWGDVGTLGSYLERLRQIGNPAFHEGEHAGHEGEHAG